ncbi:hypothetical protein HRQ91_06415 [Treponema parvum]|uniref:Uncharacterized protein n=1 Tax=Treponema parvum TaxID=138851 RepID=A0A975F3T3_9SPIR|nr:hypothetical protein [Treponema parvum]QTQ14119.1 hypothetical protein HRQ91_06415 [Treponema parvum]
MGLLKEALLSFRTAETGQSDGLLSKIEKSASPSDFYRWAKQNNFEHAAIFKPHEKKYVMTDAAGIDAKTVCSSVSSRDFFYGTFLQKDGWQSVITGTKPAEPFYQLLSEDYKESVKRIDFLKLKNDDESPVIMIFSFDSKETVLPFPVSINTEDGDVGPTAASPVNTPSKPAHLFLISLKAAIKESLAAPGLYDDDVNTILEKTVYKELFQILRDSFSSDHMCFKGQNDEIKAAMFFDEEPDPLLLQTHISKAFKVILGEKAASKVLLLSVGISKNPAETHNFLLTG